MSPPGPLTHLIHPSEDDRASIVPCPAKATGCVAQDLDGTAARINALQLGRLEEAHLTTIR